MNVTIEHRTADNWAPRPYWTFDVRFRDQIIKVAKLRGEHGRRVINALGESERTSEKGSPGLRRAKSFSLAEAEYVLNQKIHLEAYLPRDERKQFKRESRPVSSSPAG